MATGWKQLGSIWYYLNSNGTMAANTAVGGYSIGSDGAMKVPTVSLIPDKLDSIELLDNSNEGSYSFYNTGY